LSSGIGDTHEQIYSHSRLHFIFAFYSSLKLLGAKKSSPTRIASSITFSTYARSQYALGAWNYLVVARLALLVLIPLAL
jgi:hypothetical protein